MLKVLVSTKGGQGGRDSDFNFCKDGEIVYYGMECDRDENDVDGDCGCKRCLIGVNGLTGTTTFKVVRTLLELVTWSHPPLTRGMTGSLTKC